MTTTTRKKDVFAPALQQFGKDLPRLLQTNYRQWAIYHANKRLGIFATPEAAYQRAEQMGIPAAECLVEYVVEPPDPMDRSQSEGK